MSLGKGSDRGTRAKRWRFARIDAARNRDTLRESLLTSACLPGAGWPAPGHATRTPQGNSAPEGFRSNQLNELWPLLHSDALSASIAKHLNMEEPQEHKSTEDIHAQLDRLDSTTTRTSVTERKLTWRTAATMIGQVVAFLANVAVVFGVAFAVRQLNLAESTERRRIAIEAVNQTRSPEFLRAYRALKATSQVTVAIGRDEDATADNVNYVMNVYDGIALLYINDVADRCIIKDAIRDGAQEMGTIASKLSYPQQLRNNFDAFLALMDQTSCGPLQAHR
jgi:hypothetical protein